MDTQNDTYKNPNPQAGQSRLSRRMHWLIWSLMIPAGLVALGIGISVRLITTRPKAERRKPPRQARLVTVETLNKVTCLTTIPAMGTVVAARQITINPEVTGVITSINPVVLPGGIIQEGQVLFEIDSRDYQTVIKQRESELQRAELNFKLESGNQTIAQKEYSMLEEIVEEQDKELVLRQPHLQEAQAALEAARAMLEQAKLDVRRCTIRAPFNAVIQEKYAELGARVSPTSPLVTVMGVDEFWVEIRVPVNQLKWIDIPQTNGDTSSVVKIYNDAAWGEQIFREGRVVRLLGQLEEEGRMARVLVAVQDPLGLEQSNSNPPLLISSYVRTEIQGRQISDVFPVERGYIRNGNQVWIMNDQMELEIRAVDIVFGNKDTVYIRNGFQEGDQLVTTDLSTPVEGMPLRTRETSKEQPAQSSKVQGETE
jgi:RND family efflux transporter MFP subunit